MTDRSLFASGRHRTSGHRLLPGWHSMGGVLSSGLGGTATNTTGAAAWYAYALGSGGPVWEHTGTTDSTGTCTRVTPVGIGFAPAGDCHAARAHRLGSAARVYRERIAW